MPESQPEPTTGPEPDVVAGASQHFQLEGEAVAMRESAPDKFTGLIETALAMLELEREYEDSADYALATLAVARQANLMLARGAESVAYEKQKQGPKSWTWRGDAPTIDPTAAQIADRLTEDVQPEYKPQTYLR